MPNNTLNIIKRAKKSFPRLNFQKNDNFRWSPGQKTVFYREITTAEDTYIFLHELAHAALNHHDFKNDINLITHEREAWRHARTVLAPQFDIEKIDEEIIQDHLDTYRDWLYARSQCPKCAETGLQLNEHTYECINCKCNWRVNDARTCELRRRIT